jgi:hypothetical protein
MESVSHGLWKEKWGGVPSFIKEHQSANLSLSQKLAFMEDSKNPIASRWQRQPPLKTNFYLSVIQMKSSSTCLITASLCKGPLFYFNVESWYVHFASLFCIIIYCYSLIYFIFRDHTYVVSSVFTCLMIIGELATESGFCWKRDRQDTVFLKINNSREIPRNSYNIRRWT